MPNCTNDYKTFKTRIFVNSMKSNVESVNWSQDWKFVSGVSYVSMVSANLTGIVNNKPKKINNALIKGKKERRPMLIVVLVYRSKANKNCNVRVNPLCSENIGQCVPTFNRFKANTGLE